jgi:hypothetical protein
MTDNKLPWKEAKTVYANAGPKKAIEFEIAGTPFQVRPVEGLGIHTGRQRYFVACVSCDCILHAETTGPGSHVQGHMRERHNFNEDIENA